MYKEEDILFGYNEDEREILLKVLPPFLEFLSSFLKEAAAAAAVLFVVCSAY